MVLGVGALLGLGFATVSTRDFAAHLDREVHGIACSFVPGLAGGLDASGTSGCHATLMSPWSSFLRDRVWGGVPIALLAMGTFAFLLSAALAIAIAGRTRSRRWTGALVAGAAIPVGASMFWGGVAAIELGAACKVCIGIYVASAIVMVGAVGLAHRARRSPPSREPGWSAVMGGAVALGAFVAVPVLTYLAVAPSHASYVDACGTLDEARPPGAVTVPLAAGAGPGALEVLDPLCPACRAFDGRLEASGAGAELPRAGLMFPLDAACNWMVSESIHPGACAVSEAVLCAGDDAGEVLAWAFAQQASLLSDGRADPARVTARVREAFPALRRCIGSPSARARLNRGLRWAVARELPVLTPQLYVDGRRLCDADTDLGLDYALPRLVEAARRVPSSARAEGGAR